MVMFFCSLYSDFTCFHGNIQKSRQYYPCVLIVNCSQKLNYCRSYYSFVTFFTNFSLTICRILKLCYFPYILSMLFFVAKAAASALLLTSSFINILLTKVLTVFPLISISSPISEFVLP